MRRAAGAEIGLAIDLSFGRELINEHRQQRSESARRVLRGQFCLLPHRVHVAAFAMSKYEVTRGQYAVFVKESGYLVESGCYTREKGLIDLNKGVGWQDPGFAQTDEHPVVCVNWKDATAYAKWLSSKAGKRFRLPSESEWEYAARAGTTTPQYWQPGTDATCAYANVMDATASGAMLGINWSTESCTDGFAYTSPVGQFKPNAFGLYDMIGNAWEWTDDCYHASYNRAPVSGASWRATPCSRRVLRGGSWYFSPANNRAAMRYDASGASRFSYNGFRVVQGR